MALTDKYFDNCGRQIEQLKNYKQVSKTIKQKDTSPPLVTARGGKCTPPPRALGRCHRQTMRNAFTLRHVITGKYVSPPKCLCSGEQDSHHRLRPTCVCPPPNVTSIGLLITHVLSRVHNTHIEITLRATCLAKDRILHANALLSNKSYIQTRRNVSKLQTATSSNFLMKRKSDYTNARKQAYATQNG